jgi:hypothetical protein
MISSNSTWDRGTAKRPVSPAFVYGRSRVSYDFPNRRSTKIFSHKLGNIIFQDGLNTDLTASRNNLITELYGTRDVGGYVYKSVSHVHVVPTLIGSNLTVFGHGVPVKSGWENCAMIGTDCVEGESDTKCEAGKCRMGTLTRVSGDKWRYDSLTVSGLYYFVFGTESVTLRSITKGLFTLPAGVGTVNVSRVASIPATVYLPPSTYSAETFTRRVITTLNSDNSVRSLTDSVDNFLRVLLDGYYNEVRVEVGVKDKLINTLESRLPSVWHPVVRSAIETVWSQRYDGVNMTNRDFGIRSYETLTGLYGQGLQVMLSGIRGSRVSVDGSIGRPVYGKLPGVSGSYNDESRDTVAKWLTAGSDDLLSGTKTVLDHFYRTYLDPETCYPLNLDWLAQHLGFVGGLWDLEWPAKVKRVLLANAHVNRVSGSMWTQDPAQDTLRGIDMARVERVTVNIGTGAVSTSYRYTKKSYNTNTELTTLTTFNNLVVDTSRWQGILPSKGNMVTLLFMFWALGIKAHSPGEMRYSDASYFVRSGLRDRELTAPVNTPYMVDVLRLGDDTDSKTGNYPNQLIAGIGTCQDELSANTVIVRMPFYYNRNGRSWDAARQVLDNYMPSTAINRVQYAYAVADLLVADDVFFEPITA